MPKISIITINYNNATGLDKTIRSVITQTYKEFEFIVIDGQSTDTSVDVIKTYAHQLTNWISEPDGGIYDAQNKGILNSTGDYLLFLNSGDVLVDNNVLEHVSTKLNGQSFYYGNLILESNHQSVKHQAPEIIDVDFMLNSTFWHPCVFIKSSLFKEFGLYNTTFKICGDYEFFIRCLLKPNITTQYLDLFITRFDANGISNNPQQNQLQTEEREKAWRMNVSELIYENLKQQNSFARSKYATVINLLQKWRGKPRF